MIHDPSPFEARLLTIARDVEENGFDLDAEFPVGLDADLAAELAGTAPGIERWHLSRAIVITRSRRLLALIPDQPRSSFSLRPMEWAQILEWACDDYILAAVDKGLSINEVASTLCDALDRGRPVAQVVERAYSQVSANSVLYGTWHLHRLLKHPNILDRVLRTRFVNDTRRYLDDMDTLGSLDLTFAFALMWRASEGLADCGYMLEDGRLYPDTEALALVQSNHGRLKLIAEFGSIEEMILHKGQTLKIVAGCQRPSPPDEAAQEV